MRIFFCLIIFAFYGFIAQSQDYIFNSHFGFPVNEKNIYFSGINTSFRPATGIENEIFDSLIFNNYKTSDKSLLYRKLFNEHFYHKKSDEHEFILNPIIDFRYNNQENIARTGFMNTRGIVMYGRLNSRIWFNTSIYENQGSFPSHIDKFYDDYLVIPGYARIKTYKDDAYDFMTAFGNVGFRASENLFFNLGTDKIFIGDGYRSMLLSDFSCSYLNFRTSYSYKNLTFNHIITHTLNPNYNNILGTDENWSVNMAYPAKLISYNYLMWNINENFQLGFFEATVFDPDDDVWNYGAINPVPYLNTSINGFDGNNNVLAGINFSYQNKKLGVVYSQFLIDKIDFSDKDENEYKNRLAWQIGYKAFDFLNIENLLFLMEYNHAGSLTYTHSNPSIHYGHFNQALAHPAGHGFDEIVFILKYSYGNLSIFSKLNYLKYMHSGDFDMKNIFNQNDFLNASVILKTGNEIYYSDTQIIYHINKAIGLHAFGGVILRHELLRNEKDIFLQFGLRTGLRANYYDF